MEERERILKEAREEAERIVRDAREEALKIKNEYASMIHQRGCVK